MSRTGSVARLRARGTATSLAAPAGADLRDVIDIVRTEGTEAAEIARTSRVLAEIALQIDLGAIGLSDPGFDPAHPIFSVISSRTLSRALAQHREGGASVTARIVSTRTADHVVLDAGDEYALEILSRRLSSLGWTASDDDPGIEEASAEGREVRWDSTVFDAGVPTTFGHTLFVAEKPTVASRLAAMIVRTTRTLIEGEILSEETIRRSHRGRSALRSMRELEVRELLTGPVAPAPHELSSEDLSKVRDEIAVVLAEDAAAWGDWGDWGDPGLDH